MRNFLLALGFLWAVNANAQMCTISLSGNPAGVWISGGQYANYSATWRNTTGQTCYIWGVQCEIWFGGMIWPGMSIADYFKNIADLDMSVGRQSDGMILIHKGSDHYENAPGLNGPPVFFPRPFSLPPGDGVAMSSRGHDGFQSYYGGQVMYNADAIIYFTVGTP